MSKTVDRAVPNPTRFYSRYQPHPRKSSAISSVVLPVAALFNQITKMELRLVTIVLMAIMTISSLLTLCVPETEARPSRSTANTVVMPAGWSEYYRLVDGGDEHRRSVVDNECETSPGVRELCQRCAKATKSKMAYPLCCEKKLESRRFCINFLNFGLTSINDLNNP